MHFMDPPEHLPISPIYHVIWYNWCSVLWRSTGQARLLGRVGIHRYRILAFSAWIMLGSDCSTPSLSCRNTNLYLLSWNTLLLKMRDRTQLIWSITTDPWQRRIRNCSPPGVFTSSTGTRTWASQQWETLRSRPYWVLTQGMERVKISYLQWKNKGTNLGQSCLLCFLSLYLGIVMAFHSLSGVLGRSSLG